VSPPYHAEIFKQTGVHPAIESVEQSAAMEAPDLPEPDANRPHVFMDLAVGAGAKQKPLGTLVIEVFEDLAPSAAREFTLRITGGGAGRAGFVAYERTRIHKIVDGVRLEGGARKGGGGGGSVPVEECRRLCHSCAGVVSLSPTSSEFTITAGPAHHLDGEQQVVGRVLRGLEHVVGGSQPAFHLDPVA
jgi:cyclophilin family peptidyl-prolyl cis-trans isomerase